jgi:drug/metabolite transporter (DMT)-like permease
VGPRHWAGDFAVDSGEGVYVSRVAVRASVPGDRAGDYAAVIAIGVLDLAAVGLFALGSTLGLVSEVSALGSLYPITTVVLVRALLGERMTREQVIGVAAAMAGVVAISAARRPATRQGQARRVAQRARPPTPR